MQISKVYPLQLEGEEGLAAPVAKMWAKMSLMFSGQKDMTPFAGEAMFIGGLAGVLFGLLDVFVSRRLQAAAKSGSKSLLRFVPHSFGLGIAMIIPIFYSVSFFVGALVLCIIMPKFFKTSEDTLMSIGSAGIVGEGVMGLIVAILLGFGVLGG